MRRKLPDPACELCRGTGETDVAVWDNDSHTYQPTGTQPCICTVPDDDGYDPDDGQGGSQPIRPIEPTEPPNDGEDNEHGKDEDEAIPSPLDMSEFLPAALNTI